MTKQEAIALANSGWWKDASPEAIVSFQLFEERLCMDFGAFHEAVTKCLGRPVWTHEFAGDRLKKEFLHEKEPPTFDEILALIPEGKRVLFVKP